MWRMTKAAMTAAVFRRALRATFKAGGMFMGVRMKHVLKAGFQRRDGADYNKFFQKTGKIPAQGSAGRSGPQGAAAVSGPVQARAAVGDRDLQDLGNFPIGTAPLVKEEKNIPLLRGESGREDLGEGKGRMGRRGKTFRQSEDIVRLVPYGVTDDMGEGDHEPAPWIGVLFQPLRPGPEA